MSINLYPDLDKWFKTLYFRNRDWFKYRLDLTEAEQRQLFDACLQMDSALREIREVFLQKEKSTAKSAVPETKNDTFVSTRSAGKSQ